MNDTGRPRRYWELSDVERRALAPDAISDYDYVVLATINHGRLATSAWLGDPKPRHLVEDPWEAGRAYDVTVAAVLAAAMFDGQHPEGVYEEAMSWLDQWLEGRLADLASCKPSDDQGPDQAR